MYIVKKYHNTGILKGITTTEKTNVKYTEGQTYNECLTNNKITIVSVKEV